MADQDHRAGKAGHQFLQQIQRLHVEIVGRLVEHQQIGRPRQHARQDQPRPLAAGQLAHRRARLLRLEQKVLHVGDDVPLLAIDDEVLAAAVGEEMRQRLVGIEARASGRARRSPDWCRAAPCLRPARARRSAASAASSCRRRSARPARARSPRWMRVEKSLTTVRSPKLLAMPLASITSLPDSAASLAAMRGHALGAAMAAEALAHRLQFAEPAHVALAPRGDAVAQPVLLAHDLAAELVLLALFFLEHRVAPRLEMRKALVEPAGLAAIQPDGGARDALQEAAVVRDHDQRRRRAVELVLQPFDGRRGRDGWSARRAARCRAAARSRGQARRGAPRRRRARRASRRRSGRDARADRWRGADRRTGRAPLRHRRARVAKPSRSGICGR